jgi:hypothetical protein
MSEEIADGLRRLSGLLGEELARGAEYDRKVAAVFSAIRAANSSDVEESRRMLPDLWSALDELAEAGKRAPAYW